MTPNEMQITSDDAAETGVEPGTPNSMPGGESIFAQAAPWTHARIEALRATSPEYDQKIEMIFRYLGMIALFRNHADYSSVNGVNGIYVAEWQRIARANLRMIRLFAAELVPPGQVEALLDGILHCNWILNRAVFRNCPEQVRDLFRNWPLPARTHRSTRS